jgi:hypothetical protein
MIEHTDVIEFKTDLENEFEVNELGGLEGGSKWSGQHWSSKLLWDLHLQQALSGAKDWSREGLGYWMMVKLDPETLKMLELAPDGGAWVEIHERDDGIMETSYWDEDFHAVRAAFLESLCVDPEDEDDESMWDDDTYEIELATDHDGGQKFVKWLRVRGHDARIGKDTANRVDTILTSNSREANKILTELWERYSNE